MTAIPIIGQPKPTTPAIIIKRDMRDVPLPGAAVFDAIRVAKGQLTEFDVRLTRLLLHWLLQKYPGHRWSCEVKTEQGVAYVRNLFADPRQGWVIHLRNCLNWADVKKVAIEAGGELLERYGLPRGPFREQDYHHIWHPELPGVPRNLLTTDTTSWKRPDWHRKPIQALARGGDGPQIRTLRR